MAHRRLQKGYVHVYTGNGKGKTTAALGLALRAIGHGCRVFMLQFMKGSKEYGEVQAAEKYLPDLVIVQSGLETFVDKDNPSPEDMRLAREGLELARRVIREGNYDLVILDEINVAVDFKLIPLEDVLDLIHTKPAHVELVLTGRYAHPAIIRAADIVTEMNLIDHPYYHGVEAREGIEY
ncbi:cob(I)yrinic acid a,c-diamide adenosyltransferase [Desulfofundulus thermobenzoicus]|uniref:Cob(I)yrinic acid a,c-diamide adenosyltransferase n=1 Tax=Desulfofundulus thermobenzoicus TaxID=29376 RepID=A0A6N7IPA7_9FIRM|nr:cob(I)yrinic acid a,c-diamide adenosyltransferase [Desulfofundulus thermobenzoicus]MQL51862.1 cob(I)yrinic acid a,c-diamide adenosyltransferase [Desulfofundulus thermobenzoicus]HHW42392.1 cob(I)yrinic acid a,c-diamide adenosyltransferase [Desulfotomaculum sp.]